MKIFAVVAACRGLRGTVFDLFGYSRERKTERQLLRDYETLLEELIHSLRPDNHGTAVALAEIPFKIRGFGYVKDRHIIAAKADEAELLRRFRSERPSEVKAVAAE